MMQVCINNNNEEESFEWHSPSQSNRPKRDFRFKVIEVRQGPKWFIWPSRNRENSGDIDENHNKEAKTVGEEFQDFSTNQTQFSTLTSQNGYGAMRRNILRVSKRKQDGCEATSRTSSEPAPRRLSQKKEKACTEPITSAPSNTFKILSIAKKWESFDATDDEGIDLIQSCDNLQIHDSDRRWTAI